MIHQLSLTYWSFTMSRTRALTSLICSVVVLLGASPRPAYASMAAIDPVVAQQEQDYMTMTIDHHAGGIELAELGLEKTQNQTLLDLSDKIRMAQAQEIEELQGFLSDWYDQQHAPVVPAMTEQDIAQLSALNGRAFDVDYSRTFIMHHEEIIERSESILGRTEHPALADFALGVILAQTDEIRVFQSVIDNGGGPTAIPLPAPVAMGAMGLVGAALAVRWQRRTKVA
jgi:uncharacterized protein (DUF305 family)